MEWIYSLLESSGTPVLTSFLLGLLTALSPCPLATNIAAIGFIGKDLGSRKKVFLNGMLYTLGRIISYTVLGAVLILVLKTGAGMFGIQKAIGAWGALLIGVLFALAFCPASGVFYFGMLIPMSATAEAGYLLPVVFAVATSIPVLAVAWILAFSVQKIGAFYGKMQNVQKWMNLVVGSVFIIIGVCYCVMVA